MADEQAPADPGDFLTLLREGAPVADHDALLEALVAADPQSAERMRCQHASALQLREQMESQRRREAELAALYDTAGDLTAIRDLDEILGAIVRRARQLLRCDMTYLSLNDHTEGASYMKVTDGALTAEFRTLRLPLGTGLLGLVAQTGEPWFTEATSPTSASCTATTSTPRSAGSRSARSWACP
jgi:transcriptional regulator with GAF, ATPase, and Fis domain